MKVYAILLAVLLLVGGCVFCLIPEMDSAMWHDTDIVEKKESKSFTLPEVDEFLALEDLQSMSSREVSVERDSEGNIFEISGQFDDIVIRNEQDAKECLSMFREIMNIPSDAVFRWGSDSQACGYIFEQLYKGVPVEGEQSLYLSVAFDKLYAVCGKYEYFGELSTKPKLCLNQCKTLQEGELLGRNILDSLLVVCVQNGEGNLNWKCEIEPVDENILEECYYVDSNNGNIVDHWMFHISMLF